MQVRIALFMQPCILTYMFITLESFTQGRRSLREEALSHAECLGLLMGCNSALGRMGMSSFGSSPSMP